MENNGSFFPQFPSLFGHCSCCCCCQQKEKGPFAPDLHQSAPYEKQTQLPCGLLLEAILVQGSGGAELDEPGLLLLLHHAFFGGKFATATNLPPLLSVTILMMALPLTCPFLQSERTAFGGSNAYGHQEEKEETDDSETSREQGEDEEVEDAQSEDDAARIEQMGNGQKEVVEEEEEQKVVETETEKETETMEDHQEEKTTDDTLVIEQQKTKESKKGRASSFFSLS